ncbi:hypothetical protein BJF82_14965 [Kytococcus sp. CUA-901]|nr:hypothetical protein BJF82_14965 [Kytococcus sp. CUA-901]
MLRRLHVDDQPVSEVRQAPVSRYAVPARLANVSTQPPTSRPVTSTSPPPSSRVQPPAWSST